MKNLETVSDIEDFCRELANKGVELPSNVQFSVKTSPIIMNKLRDMAYISVVGADPLVFQYMGYKFKLKK